MAHHRNNKKTITTIIVDLVEGRNEPGHPKGLHSRAYLSRLPAGDGWRDTPGNADPKRPGPLRAGYRHLTLNPNLDAREDARCKSKHEKPHPTRERKAENAARGTPPPRKNATSQTPLDGEERAGHTKGEQGTQTETNTQG